MKILAISDRPPKAPINEILDYEDLDLICVLGDLDLFSFSELEFVTHIPKIGVYGDKCSGTYFEKLGIRNIHLETFKHKGLLFGGFQGAVSQKKEASYISYSQEESVLLLKDFPRVDVMISHTPPYGVNDDPSDPLYTGFKGLRYYVSEKKPRCLIHGHTKPPEEFIVRRLEETDIIYVHEEKVIRI